MSRKTLKSVGGVIVLGLSVISLCCSVGAEDCEQEINRYCPPMATKWDFKKTFDCAKQYTAQLSQECQDMLEQSLQAYITLKEGCENELKEYCGLGLDEMERVLKENRDVCVLEHWGKLDEQCQIILMQEVPYLDLLRQEGGLDQYESFGQDYTTKTLAGNGKTVRISREKDGMIWYVADLIKRDVIEKYEFCPDISKKGLVSFTNFRVPICDYKVHSAWGKDLIRELKDHDVFPLITDRGIRDDFFKPQNDIIYQIIEKYSGKCPQGFLIDIYNYASQEADIVCTPPHPQNCPLGWERTSPKKNGDFFGCRLYASCEQTDPESYDIGDPRFCAVCRAGGCIDPSRTRPDSNVQMGHCWVSEGNSGQTPACEATRIETEMAPTKTIGKVEYHYDRNQCRKVKIYNTSGVLIDETNGYHYFAEITPKWLLHTGTKSNYYDDGSLKEYQEQYHFTVSLTRAYDQAGNLIKEEDKRKK